VDRPARARRLGTAVALARLPTAVLGVPGLDADPAWRLAAAFLLGYRGHTRRAYFADIRAWYAWCASIDLAPLSAPAAPCGPVDRRAARTPATGDRSRPRPPP